MIIGPEDSVAGSASAGIEQIINARADGVSGVAFAPDGKSLASYDNTARIWAIATGKLRLALTGHTDKVSVATGTPIPLPYSEPESEASDKLWLEQVSFIDTG